ncbi:MAG: hypothetical protein WB696_30645 [Chthoniobacterales bacterium]
MHKIAHNLRWALANRTAKARPQDRSRQRSYVIVPRLTAKTDPLGTSQAMPEARESDAFLEEAEPSTAYAL